MPSVFYIDAAVGMKELFQIDRECQSSTQFRNYGVSDLDKYRSGIGERWRQIEDDSGNKRVVFLLRENRGEQVETVAMIAGELIKGDEAKFEELIIFNTAVKPELRRSGIFSKFAFEAISAILDFRQDSTDAAEHSSKDRTPMTCSEETKKMLLGIRNISASRSSGLIPSNISEEMQTKIKTIFPGNQQLLSSQRLNEVISEINKAGILIDKDGRNYCLDAEKLAADKRQACEALFSEISASFKNRYVKETPENSVGASFPISIAEIIFKFSESPDKKEGKSSKPQIRVFLGDSSGEFGFQVKFDCNHELIRALQQKEMSRRPSAELNPTAGSNVAGDMSKLSLG